MKALGLLALALVVAAAAARTPDRRLALDDEGAEEGWFEKSRVHKGARASAPPPLGTGAPFFEAAESRACTPLDPSLIIYNRVPKSASTTVHTLMLSLLRSSQQFTMITATPFKRSSEERRRAWAIYQWLASRDSRIVHVRHSPMIPGAKGTYINFARDPIARVESLFYYTRARGQVPDDGTTIDECVARPESEWTECGVSGAVSRYFCDGAELCQPRIHGEDAAFSYVTGQIETWFAVVGVVERFDESLHVLEQRFPRYFAGMSQLYRGGFAAKNTGTTKRPEMSRATRERLEEALSFEYRIYDFLVKRLEQQLAACP